MDVTAQLHPLSSLGLENYVQSWFVGWIWVVCGLPGQ